MVAAGDQTTQVNERNTITHIQRTPSAPKPCVIAY